MIRIGFLTPEYPHPRLGSTGGLGTSLKNLTQELSKQEGVSTVVIVYGQERDQNFKDGEVEIICLKHQAYAYFGWYLHRRFINKHVNKIIKTHQIDLLEVPDWTGISALMRFKVPLVMRLHGSDTYFCHLENRPQKWKNFWFEKLALQKADALIAPTQFAADLTLKLMGVKPKQLRVIHYGLDLKYFNNSHPAVFEEQLILYYGTLIRKKGVFELVEIFNQLIKGYPRARLVMIGSDSADIETSSSSTWALMKPGFSEAAIKQVSYLGPVAYETVKTHLARAHVCVFPSFAETLGMVTIEAMAMKKPVVNTSIGWAKELIQSGVDGYLADPKDHQLFVDYITSLFKNLDLCACVGSAARKTVELKFDITQTMSENMTFYRSLAGK